MVSWNLLGVLLWVIIILYLVFVVQNIRKRRITMIIKKHRQFSWPNFLVDVIEIVVLIFGIGWLFNKTMLDNCHEYWGR